MLAAFAFVHGAAKPGSSPPGRRLPRAGWKLQACLLLLLAGVGGGASGQQMLTFSAFPDAPPMTRSCERILRKAYAELGIDIQVLSEPAARALLSARQGRTDGDLCRSRQTGEFGGALLRIEPALLHTYGVAFATRPIRLHGWSSLASYRVGYDRGKVGIELRMQGPRVYPSNGVENGLRKLAAGRVDIHVEEFYSAVVVLRRTGLKGIHPLSPALERYPMHHLLNARHRDLVQPLEKVLARMQRDGEMRRIEQEVLREYGLEQLQPPPLAR